MPKTPQNRRDLVSLLSECPCPEISFTNVELKSNWHSDHGSKMSGLANRESGPQFLVIGFNDEGTSTGRGEDWAKTTEEQISQAVNKDLDPVAASIGITCERIGAAWVVVVQLENRGSVVRWRRKAYKMSGTTCVEMPADEELRLLVKLPGTHDFSKQRRKHQINYPLVRHYISKLAERSRTNDYRAFIQEKRVEDGLEEMGVADTVASDILFGRCQFRIISYDAKYGDTVRPRRNEAFRGLLNLVDPQLRDNILGKDISMVSAFSEQMLTEAFVNAVAHTAYYQHDGDITVELWSDRLCVSNICIPDAAYFANKWFSLRHASMNPLLMELLRSAGYADELGRGKNVIVSEALQSGLRPPEVGIERAGQFSRWRLFLHGAHQEGGQVALFDKLKETFSEREAFFAHALVLWGEDQSRVLKYYLSDDYEDRLDRLNRMLNGPVLYSKSLQKLFIKPWVKRMLHGEGVYQYPSPAEQNVLRSVIKKEVQDHHGGCLTNALLRKFLGLSQSARDIGLARKIINSWCQTKDIEATGRGCYQWITSGS